MRTKYDFIGHTAEQLETELEAIDARMRLMHRDERGQLRSLTDAEQRQWDELMVEHDTVVNLLTKQRSAAGLLGKRGRLVVGGAAGATRHYKVDAVFSDFDPADVLKMHQDQVRDVAFEILEARGKDLRPASGDRVNKLLRDASEDGSSYLARRMAITDSPAYRTAWRKVMSDPNGHAFLSDAERGALSAFKELEAHEYRGEVRTMSEGTSSAGGYGVPICIDPSIILTAQGTLNPFLELARAVDVNTNAWKGVTSAGVTWAFQAEGSAVADGSPTLAQPVVTVFMARGFIPFSIELGQDYPDFANEMGRLLAAGYDELTVDKFSRGSGSGEPQGIITGLDGVAASQTRLTTAGSLGVVDVYNVWNNLPQRFRRRAAWMMQVATNSAIRQMGNYLQLHAMTVQLPESWASELLGRGVYDSPYFSGVVNTTGHFNQLVVGDFGNGYLIARRGGMNTELVPTLVDVTNNRPTGQRGWFAFARVGGAVVDTNAFQLLNQT
jgi:HK97 family phage major capsid protein